MIQFYEQIKTNLPNGYIKSKYIFGIPFITSETTTNTDGSRKKRSFFSLLKKAESYQNNSKEKFQPMFYLKINRTDYFAFQCIQHWINIINELNADFYFICDKNDLKKEVLKKIKFHNPNIKFIKSQKRKLKNIIKNIATPFWYNATYAQLTTFFHAQEISTTSFFNIDADDTMLVCETKNAAKILKLAQNYADKENIKAFSLDMHVTQFRNKHWSFGITYTNNNFKWIDIFKNIKNNSWQYKYKENYCYDFNLDWFMTYLKTFYNDKIKTFYVENLLFIHWATLFCLHVGYTVQKTTKGKTYYPLFKYFKTTEELSEVFIPDEVIKLDIGLLEEDCLEFGRNNIVNEEHAMNVVKWWHTWK